MTPRGIPKSEWSKFFDTFTREHTGWTITLELIGTEIGVQIQDHELVFEGISSEKKKMSEPEIMIMAGERLEGHITHRIARPIEVSFDEESSSALIMIKGADGITILLRFRPPTFLEVLASNRALASKV